MEKKGVFNKVGTFFREVREETKGVSWPTRRETFRYTMIVIGASIAVAMLLGSFDYILMEALRRFVF